MRNIKTKSGLASFYIVTFVTLILSVIVMSYVRISYSDTARTINDDLYQSAYDSALAGVEDARIALIKYQECLSKPIATGCSNIIDYIANKGDNCDSVAKALGRKSAANGEVMLVETTDYNNSEAANMDQAYTCVKVSLDVADYRGMLSGNTRVLVVPIRVKGEAKDVNSIEVSWFSSAVANGDATVSINKSGFFGDSNQVTNDGEIPPVVVDVYQTDQTYTIGELSLNNAKIGTDHFSLVLNPKDGTDRTKISTDTVFDSNDKYNYVPQKIACDSQTEFRCNALIQLPKPYKGGNRNADTFFLRIELPYGQPMTDFAIKLYKDADGKNQIAFDGIQAHVDSTGRANDLVRRVETRIDLIDDFPFPEFTIQLNPSSDSSKDLVKDKVVAKNCWYTVDEKSDNSINGVGDCSGQLDGVLNREDGMAIYH